MHSQALVRHGAAVRRFILALLPILCSVCVSACSQRVTEVNEPVDQAQIPLVEVYAKINAAYTKTLWEWEVLLNNKGEGTLTVWTYDGKKSSGLKSNEKKMLALARIVEEARFFDLPKQIGKSYPDDPDRTIRIKTATQDYTIKIFTIENNDPNEVDSAGARANRVWNAIEDFIDRKAVRRTPPK